MTLSEEVQRLYWLSVANCHILGVRDYGTRLMGGTRNRVAAAELQRPRRHSDPCGHRL